MTVSQMYTYNSMPAKIERHNEILAREMRFNRSNFEIKAVCN